MRYALTFLCLLCVCLVPSPARSQSYTSTQSALAYVYNGSAHVLEMQSEWLYSNAGPGSYQWAGNAVTFDLTISKFESIEDYENGNAYSVNLVTLACSSSEWSVGLYSPNTVRVYGVETTLLDDGWYYALQMQPKAHGSFRSSPYASWVSFVWPGQTKTLVVDKTHP